MRKPPPRKLGHEDAALWGHVAREVRPLRRTDLVAAPARPSGDAPEKPKPARKARAAAPNTAPRPKTPPAPAVLGAGVAVGLDRRQATRLRRGQLALDARVDLHGMTLEQARQALFGFLDRQRARGARCVLVITGKGLRGTGSGVIRNELPRWLNDPELRPGIVAFTQAQPRDGGSGAFYIYLRRDRAR